MAILPKVLELLNKAKTLEDGCWGIEAELRLLKENYPGKIEVLFTKDENAFNALLVIVFDAFTRFFIVSQEGSSSSFYMSPGRLEQFSQALAKGIENQGRICPVCETLVPEEIKAEGIINAWQCPKCNASNKLNEDKNNFVGES